MGQGYGAFGKIASLGDFFQGGAPPGFVAPWDAWLQGAMVTSAEAGGDHWEGQYLSAPLWRFSLSPGLAGPGKALGVLMPSVDRVGRRFPLTLVCAPQTEGPAALDHLSQAGTFETLERLALATLDDLPRDDLMAGLAALAPVAPHPAAPLRRGGESLVLTQATQGGLAPELAAGLLSERYRQPSLWQAILPDTARLMVCEGLPGPQEARALFDLSAPLWAEARPVS
jgi:type VI secretion system protein ImpM